MPLRRGFATISSGGGRLVHIKVHETGMLSRTLAESLPGADPQHLIQKGSVYRQKLGGPSPLRVLHDIPIYPGEYVRVYQNNRTYDCATIRWDKLKIYEDEDFLIVNKPAGIPTVATPDNFRDNVVYLLQQHVGAKELYATQRLDTDTSGLLIVGKTQEFAAHMTKSMKGAAVKKVYRALVAGRDIAEGVLRSTQPLVHYTPSDSTRRPRQFFEDAQDNTRMCALNIVSCSRVRAGSLDHFRNMHFSSVNNTLSKSFKGLEKFFSNEKILTFAELKVELLTGRTHQIRGQLHAVGLPFGMHIAGDNMYAGASSAKVIDAYRSSPYLALQVIQLCKLKGTGG